LSSYPSSILEKYTRNQQWQKMAFRQKVSVNAKAGNQKTKTEMLVANYPIAEQLKILEA
jgi:DNA adenine methylase